MQSKFEENKGIETLHGRRDVDGGGTLGISKQTGR